MTPFIVVGVDGSEIGQHALRWAVTENRLRNAWVQAVHVWSSLAGMSSIGPVTAPLDMVDLEQCAKAVLADSVRAVPEASANDRVEPVLVQGTAPTVLLDRARDAELLVVGTRGRGGFKGLLLGSVSQQCVSHATCPVVVVPRDAPLPDASDVIVGVDGSEGSQVALQFALAEARRRRSRLVVAHAWWTQYPASSAETLPFLSINRAEYTARSHEMLAGTVERARAATGVVDVETQLVPLEDAPARGLLTLANGAGLLVVGTRGRGGFKGVLLGSVSQQCVQHAPCAVAVVPSH